MYVIPRDILLFANMQRACDEIKRSSISSLISYNLGYIMEMYRNIGSI